MFYWFFSLVIVWFGTIMKFHIFGNNSENQDQILLSVTCYFFCYGGFKNCSVYSANYTNVVPPIPAHSFPQGYMCVTLGKVRGVSLNSKNKYWASSLSRKEQI